MEAKLCAAHFQWAVVLLKAAPSLSLSAFVFIN